MTVTTAARRLCREHNDEKLRSGWIYLVDLETGRITNFVGTYAARQIEEGDDLYGKYAVMRISHGRLTEKRAQEFIDAKGKGW